LKYGLVDRSGVVRIKPRYTFARGISEGLAAVEIGERCGYINADNAVAIGFRFDSCQSFSEGLETVGVKGLNKSLPSVLSEGVINRKGNFIVAPELVSVGRFDGGLARAAVDYPLPVTPFVPVPPEYQHSCSTSAYGVPDNDPKATHLRYIDASGAVVAGEFTIDVKWV